MLALAFLATGARASAAVLRVPVKAPHPPPRSRPAPPGRHHHHHKRTRRPRIMGLRVTAVAPTSATVTGMAATHGRPVLVHFQYGRSGYHLITTFGPWRGAGPITAQLSGLAPGTRYHVRMVATSCSGCPQGTVRGRTANFTTAPATYQNPVFGDLPDPASFDDRPSTAMYWSYGTGELFPISKSSDLVHWAPAGTAFPARPGWVPQQGAWDPWAPSVVRTGRPCPGTPSANCYVMFYAARSASTGLHCIGVATALSPAGPFADQGMLQTDPPTSDAAGRPFGCGDAAGYGYIDPAPFIDGDGNGYLYLSADQVCAADGGCTVTPTISVIPLAGDLVHAAGPRAPLFAGDAGTWEAQHAVRPTVENPWMVKHAGIYYMLYSGGSWQAEYGTGYATAPTPTGPFAKGPGNPILRQTADVLSPGGGSVTVGPHGGDWLAYHARAGGYDQPRTLRIDPLVWGADGTLSVRGPTTTPQSPVP
jgi:beta-xylosidase